MTDRHPLKRILIANYDPVWQRASPRRPPPLARRWARLRCCIEHVGSTAVPGLAAKPVIDVLLLVKNSADEESSLPALIAAGYRLRIREPHWHQHRLFNRDGAEVNLHVFSSGCREVERMIAFRDRQRRRPSDRELYQRAKLALARKKWKSVDEYAQAKTAIVTEIMARALGDGQ